MKYIFYILKIFILFSLFYIISCEPDKDNDNSMSELDISINKFIWEGMNFYYLWTDNVTNLDENKINTEQARTDIADDEADHKKFFNSLLYQPGIVDRFSFIIDNYIDFEKEIYSGISKSMGFDFQLYLLSYDGDEIIGEVKYVLKNSPADKAHVKRGLLFTKIDGIVLTKSNFMELLSKETYTLNNYLNSSTYRLFAVELQENPILIDTIYTRNSKKIAYLMYNQFVPDFDSAVNECFARYKEKGIDELIVDLRYNSGGSMNSCINIASMILDKSKKVLLKQEYNKNIQNLIVNKEGVESLIVYNTEYLIEADTTKKTPINSLGLSKVYFISSNRSASASELLINALSAHINIVVVGDETVGKNQGSITIKDEDRFGNVNGKHTWAIQPIIVQYVNNNNTFSIEPTKSIIELSGQLDVLGSVDEPLLSYTIGIIENNKKSLEIPFITPTYQYFKSIDDFKPYRKSMFIDINMIKFKN